MKKLNSKVNEKMLTTIKEEVESECEAKFSKEQINALKENLDFVKDKEKIFNETPGRKYLGAHKRAYKQVITVKITAFAFFLSFITIYFLYLANQNETDAAFFLGISLSSAFLYFSILSSESDYQKYIYEFYFDKYEKLLENWIELSENKAKLESATALSNEDIIEKSKLKVPQEKSNDKPDKDNIES